MGEKTRMKKQRRQAQSNQTRQRAEIIMKVRCGLMTATEAARVLGVSRKTYYKWEQRGLAALFDGLQEKSAGRPETAREEIREAEVEKQMAMLRRENELLQKKMELREFAHQMQLQAKQDGAKKK